MKILRRLDLMFLIPGGRMTEMAAEFNHYDAVRKTAPPAGTTGRSTASLSSFGGEG